MIRYRCDGCGVDLKRDGSNRYIVKIEAYAAAGKLEFTREEIERDHEAEIHRLISEMKNRSPDELEDQIYRLLKLDLCPSCHSKFLEAPLAGLHDADASERRPGS